MADSSQKFIARNRAPRVQIEYDVELYGAEKKVQLPFVMGVMADLMGKSRNEQPSVADRKFLEIDVDNFDDRMKSLAPRAAFTVPNTLTGEGNLSVDLTFESMKDFTPGAIAAKIDALRPLLEARQQLQTLMAYMDGKTGAEALIEKLLANPALLSSLNSAEGSQDQNAAIESLRGAALPETREADTATDVLAGLRTAAPADDVGQEDEDQAQDILRDLAAAPVVEADDPAGAIDDVLGDLAATVPAAGAVVEDVAEILDSIPEAEGTNSGGDDSHDAALGSLAAVSDTPEKATEVEDVLAALPEVETEPEEDFTDVLVDLAADQSDAEDVETEDPDLTALLGDLETEQTSEKTEDPDLASLLDDLPKQPDEQGPDDVLADLSSPPLSTEEAEADLSDLLADLTEPDPKGDGADPDLEAMLADSPDDVVEEGDTDLEGLLAGLEDGEAEPSDDADLEDLLGEVSADEPAPKVENTEDDSGLDHLLDDLDEDSPADGEPDASEDDLDDLLAGFDTSDETDEDLDDLLAGLEEEAESEDRVAPDSDDTAEDLGLNDLLGDLDGAEDADTDLDLDALLGGEDETAPPAEIAPEFAFGTLSAERPEPEKLVRKRFRIAILGDFTGRSARGQIEVGEELSQRAAIPLDPDTVEDVIEGFATELVLPIGKDNAGVAISLSNLDGLHPDELFENVPLFSELVSLRKQLQGGATADHAVRNLTEWAEKYGTPVRVPKLPSAGSAVRADLRLSAFQQLIGDSSNALSQARAAVSPVQDILERIVGPHVRAAPHADAPTLQAAVDAALSDAMRLVLHHPEFQALEVQWRSLDLIARSVDVGDDLEVVLYDVSAEELAADLAAQDDLSASGFARLLTEGPLDEETGRGAYSALIGMYSFEETPPHAELLGRIARVAAHVDAPFFAAISPGFLQTAKSDRPALTASAWDTLQGMSEAGHLGLVSPRFLLRRPYGAKTDPCYEFDFEEFTETEGLRGMLWANPVVLVAILLARSFRAHGPSLQLGQIMSLGGMPYHYVTDRFGDQVALPCTERNIDLDKIALAQERGFMAVASVRGRDELRLTSFQSVAGGEILGPWTGVPAPEPSPPDLRPVAVAAGQDAEETASDGKDDDLNLDDMLGDDDSDGDVDLDELLAGFGEDDSSDADDDDDDAMDAELAALLDDL